MQMKHRNPKDWCVSKWISIYFSLFFFSILNIYFLRNTSLKEIACTKENLYWAMQLSMSHKEKKKQPWKNPTLKNYF